MLQWICPQGKPGFLKLKHSLQASISFTSHAHHFYTQEISCRRQSKTLSDMTAYITLWGKWQRASRGRVISIQTPPCHLILFTIYFCVQSLGTSIVSHDSHGDTSANPRFILHNLSLFIQVSLYGVSGNKTSMHQCLNAKRQCLPVGLHFCYCF